MDDAGSGIGSKALATHACGTMLSEGGRCSRCCRVTNPLQSSSAMSMPPPQSYRRDKRPRMYDHKRTESYAGDEQIVATCSQNGAIGLA